MPAKGRGSASSTRYRSACTPFQNFAAWKYRNDRQPAKEPLVNPTQVQTTLAPLVAFLAGLLAGKGVFGLDATTWATIIGSVAAFGATIWGAIAARKTAIVSQVAAMPEVQSIKLESSAPASLVNATP